MTDEMAEALREVDALCPGSEPIAPPPEPPWWSGIGAWHSPSVVMLAPWLGGHIVTLTWLEANRHRLSDAIDELDGDRPPSPEEAAAFMPAPVLRGLPLAFQQRRAARQLHEAIERQRGRR